MKPRSRRRCTLDWNDDRSYCFAPYRIEHPDHRHRNGTNIVIDGEYAKRMSSKERNSTATLGIALTAHATGVVDKF